MIKFDHLYLEHRHYTTLYYTIIFIRGCGHMLYWALVFFIIAIIAGIFGFGGIAAGATTIAFWLFWLFVIVFVISLIVGLVRRGPRR